MVAAGAVRADLRRWRVRTAEKTLGELGYEGAGKGSGRRDPGLAEGDER